MKVIINFTSVNSIVVRNFFNRYNIFCPPLLYLLQTVAFIYALQYSENINDEYFTIKKKLSNKLIMENRKLNYLDLFILRMIYLRTSATNCTWYSYNILIEISIIKNDTSSLSQILFLIKIQFSRFPAWPVIQLEIEKKREKIRNNFRYETWMQKL